VLSSCPLPPPVVCIARDPGVAPSRYVRASFAVVFSIPSLETPILKPRAREPAGAELGKRLLHFPSTWGLSRRTLGTAALVFFSENLSHFLVQVLAKREESLFFSENWVLSRSFKEES